MCSPIRFHLLLVDIDCGMAPGGEEMVVQFLLGAAVAALIVIARKMNSGPKSDS